MQHLFVLLTAALPLITTLAPSAAQPRVSDPILYTGMCGASAGVAVNSNLFIVAADEANQLRVYRRDEGGPPVQIFDLTTQLELDRRAPQADIEGAARVGDRVYWISSHSRNHLGKEHANRYRFFATTLHVTNDTVKLSFVGEPYKNLLRDLVTAPTLKPFNLLAASKLPPKARGALNIEGLAAMPDGKLLIGFRNPIPGGRALLVPLENPEEVLAGRSARFGQPIQLELNGLGIRDMAFWGGKYLLIAGSYTSGGRPRLYTWSGGDSPAKHLKDIDLKGLNAEAVIIYPDKGFEQVQLLSDDSPHQEGGARCQELSEDQRSFRSIWVSPEMKRKRR